MLRVVIQLVNVLRQQFFDGLTEFLKAVVSSNN